MFKVTTHKKMNERPSIKYCDENFKEVDEGAGYI